MKGSIVAIVFLIFALAVNGSCFSLEENSYEFLTIPKSGTHLLRKIITLIDHDFPSYRVGHIQPHHINSNAPKILWIRDPRDIIISKVFWFRAKNYYWPPNTLVSEEFNNLLFDEQIEYVINFPDEQLSIKKYVKLALDLMKDPNIHVYRFEDFIGREGQGDPIIQKKNDKSLSKSYGI